jgi:hypothetical protein
MTDEQILADAKAELASVWGTEWRAIWCETHGQPLIDLCARLMADREATKTALARIQIRAKASRETDRISAPTLPLRRKE